MFGKCKDCLCFKSNNYNGEGLCRKHAPDTHYVNEFPKVDSSDGCGDFEPKEITK